MVYVVSKISDFSQILHISIFFRDDASRNSENAKSLENLKFENIHLPDEVFQILSEISRNSDKVFSSVTNKMANSGENEIMKLH